MRWTFLGEPEGVGWGAAYVHELTLPQPLANMRRATAWGLETTSVNVTVEPYVVDGRAGWIGTGIDSEGGWRCWSVVAPLERDDENMTSLLSVNAKFENETLNEHLVKTMRIEIAPGNALALPFLALPVMPAVADDLILDLKYGQSDARANAAESLGEIEDARAVGPLVEVMKDEDPEV